MYQAVFETSDYIRERIKRYHDYGIGVEGTILLGLDNHDEDFIKRLIDFLLEIDLDLAEFTVLTPFPQPISMCRGLSGCAKRCFHFPLSSSPPLT